MTLNQGSIEIETENMKGIGMNLLHLLKKKKKELFILLIVF